MKIMWKQGSRINTDAAVFHGVVEKIMDKNNGSATPDDIVDEARKKRSPIHKEFEWDDAKAAEIQRRTHAAYLLRSVEIIRDDAPTVRSRALEISREHATAKQPARNVYKRVEDILADPVARDELLAGAVRDAIAFRRRYAALSELATVFAAMGQFIDKAADG